jgi:hypothetical protein
MIKGTPMTPTKLQEAMKFKNGLIEIRCLARTLPDSECFSCGNYVGQESDCSKILTYLHYGRKRICTSCQEERKDWIGRERISKGVKR